MKWPQIRSKLKEQFEDRGIITCELNLVGCWKDNALSFAHLDKRRNLTEEQLWEVVLACVPCHQKVEYAPNMREKLQAVIDKRN